MIWRTIPGFPGYAISDEGDLVSPTRKRLSRCGPDKNTYHIKPRTGAIRKRSVAFLLEAAKRGRIVDDPLKRTPPEGFVAIPNLPPFYINRKGRVWNNKTGKEYTWLYVRPGSKSPRVRLGDPWYSISTLLEMTFGHGAYIEAGLPPPRGTEDELMSHKYDDPKPSRRCHDCGKPTNNYRCFRCRRKWRQKHDVMLVENGGDIESVNS